MWCCKHCRLIKTLEPLIGIIFFFCTCGLSQCKTCKSDLILSNIDGSKSQINLFSNIMILILIKVYFCKRTSYKCHNISLLMTSCRISTMLNEILVCENITVGQQTPVRSSFIANLVTWLTCRLFPLFFQVKIRLTFGSCCSWHYHSVNDKH